jgi:phosphopantothenoylcysteine decarboxylase/phosphopantothenate--cysteine ligase
MTFEALSGNPVHVEMFPAKQGQTRPLAHIELSDSDLMVVAPATASTIGKMAAGIADNLLLSTFLATEAPVVLCPAMNHRMLNNAAVQANLTTLAARGVEIIYPEAGRLACGEAGAGRLADIQVIYSRVQELLGSERARDLQGVRVVVTAGGTREPIDAVRHISNKSSGKMGYSIASAASSRGAEVTVIDANCSLPRQAGIRYIDVETAADLKEALEHEAPNQDVLFMAAAVSDYEVSLPQAKGKLKSGSNINLNLVPTNDIVSGLGRSELIKVGFAAEFGIEALSSARQKLEEKGLEMLVFNDISRADIGFESDSNEITLIRSGKDDTFVPRTTKLECAQRILDISSELLGI